MDGEAESNWATKYTGMDNEFELEWQKIKEKELNRLYSMFRTSVHGYFPDLSLAYNMVRVVEGKIV